MPVAVVTEVSSFTIRQLTGERRTVELVGRALPYRPFSLQTRQRVEIEWYAGNPEGAATVLGAAEGSTTLQGAWKTKFLGAFVGTAGGNARPFTVDGVGIPTARDAVAMMDIVVREGQPVEVTWDEIVRHGYITEFDPDWDNVNDVRWSMKFEWISRGETTEPPVYISRGTAASTASEVTAQTDDLTDTINVHDNLPVSSSQGSFMSSVSSVMTRVQNTADQIQGAVSNASATVTSPVDTARAVISASTALVGQTQEIFDETWNIVPGTINAVQSLPEQSFGTRLAAEVFVEDVRRKALTLRNTALRNRAAMSSQIEKTLLAIHTARADEDLRDVSRLYYTTPNEWRRLLIFNILESSVLVAGQQVLVPKITNDSYTGAMR